MAKGRNLYGLLNLKTFIIMKNLKTLFVIVLLFVTYLTFGNNEPKETIKTLFGTEMQQNEVIQVTYQNVSFYVAIGSPIAELYKKDNFKFQIFMALHLDNYKNENKTFLNS